MLKYWVGGGSYLGFLVRETDFFILYHLVLRAVALAARPKFKLFTCKESSVMKHSTLKVGQGLELPPDRKSSNQQALNML